MTLEDLNKLEDGALLKVKGTTFTGERVKKFIYFQKDMVNATKKTYRVGCWLYPISWLLMPTLAEINDKVREIETEYKERLNKLRNGYCKTKNNLGK